MLETPKFSVSEFLEVLNQTLEYSYASILVEGEVSGFKVNQGKWVFFDLKDEQGSISCFMPLWELRTELEDGMKVVVRGFPKVTNWGKFSFTVRQIMPVGEGSIKKSFEKLKAKLEKEGLFDPAKKRSLPENLTKIGVISSTSAAGYADFCKIINARWGGLDIQVCHTQVQGLIAPDQIIRALKYLNERQEVQVIAIIRGGGSADDLACFNDEALVRAIAASKIPVITGIGHEIDESLSDLAADIRASTPSNCAELLSKDRKTEQIEDQIRTIRTKIDTEFSAAENKIAATLRILESLNPDLILSRGYAILSGKLELGNVVKITTKDKKLSAEIKEIKERR
ncbi:exodeoxyribonuclease VII large subunit [Candidatus Saccharibacteria bacterium]|nr:exodeoxyribonuclease VII large subunit [Candidatus Saccharibacteria bacterium]